MKRQDEDLTYTTCYKTGKRKNKVSLHMHDTLKNNCENNLNKKNKTKKQHFIGVRTHINENR